MSESNQTQNPKSYWSKPNNWIRLATVFLVFIYTGIQLWQTILIRTNNTSTLRAFVNAGPAHAAAAWTPDKLKLVAVIIPLANSGGTATKGLQFTTHCAPSVESYEDPWQLLHQGKIEHLPQFIAPHAVVTPICTFTADQLLQVSLGKLHAYVLGEITYFDRIEGNTLHTTEFSWELINPVINDATGFVGVTFAPRGQHNCADEECPGR